MKLGFPCQYWLPQVAHSHCNDGWHAVNSKEVRLPGNLPNGAWHNLPERQRGIRVNLRLLHQKRNTDLFKIESWDCTQLCVFSCQPKWLGGLRYNAVLTSSRAELQIHEVKDTEDWHYFSEMEGKIAQHQRNGKLGRWGQRLDLSFTFRKQWKAWFPAFQLKKQVDEENQSDIK